MSFIERLKKSPFLRNFSFLILGNFIGRAINMITNVILARWLTPIGYGKYSLFLTYVVLFSSIASLGMQFITNKYVARNQENSRKYLYLSLLWRFIGYILTVLIIIILSRTSCIELTQTILFALLIGVFLDSLWSCLQSIAFGMQRMGWNCVVDITISLITALLYISIQYYDTSLLTVEVVIIVYLVLYFIRNFIYFLCLHHSNLITGTYKFNNIDIYELKNFFKEGFPFYILVVMGLFTGQLPTIFLDLNSGTEEVAYFNTANKLLLPLTILLSTAMTALFPNQAKLFSTDKKRYWEQAKKVLDYLILIGSISALLISIFRNDIVSLLYGESYKNTGAVLAFQCWYFVMFTIFSFNGNILGAADKQKLLSQESIIYAIITTPIIYYGSFYGACGLSIAYAFSTLLNIIYIFFFLHKVSNKFLSFKVLTKYILIIGSFLLITLISNNFL